MPLTNDFPPAGYISDAARTQQEARDAFESWLQATRELPGAGGTWPTLTIAAGVIAPTVGHALVDTEAGAASDDLTAISQTALEDGRLFLVRSTSAARVVTIKHAAGGAGQIAIADAADLALTDPSMCLLLRRNGTLWEEVGRFWGNQKSARRLREGLSTLPVGRGADLVAAATLVLGTDGDYFHVTGVTPITAISAMPAGTVIRLAFDAATPVVYSASLLLNGQMNYTAAVGDAPLQFIAEPGGVWREYGRAGVAAPVLEYATPGTFTWVRPSGVTRIRLQACGGGGGGGGYTGTVAGGGGGAGAGIDGIIIVSGDLDITVGAGGRQADAGGGATAGGSTIITGTGVSITLGGGGAGAYAGGSGGTLQGVTGGAGGAEGGLAGSAGNVVGHFGLTGAGGTGNTAGSGTSNGGPAWPWMPGGQGGPGWSLAPGGSTQYGKGGDGVGAGAPYPGVRGGGGCGSSTGWSASAPGGAGYVRIEIIG